MPGNAPEDRTSMSTTLRQASPTSKAQTQEVHWEFIWFAWLEVQKGFRRIGEHYYGR